MIIRIKSLIIYLLAVLLIFGCSERKEPEDKTIVSVSILPQKFIIDQLCNNEIDVNVLIPPGASPATYEPSPKQVRDIAKSELYIRIGYIEFEKAWMEKFQSVNPEMMIADQSEGVKLIHYESLHDDEHSDHHGHGHSHGVIDPHIWTSPVEMKVQVENVLNALKKVFPNRSLSLKKNADILQHKIDSVDNALKELFKEKANKGFLIYHPSMAYFARDYGLEQLPIEFEGKEPTSSYIKDLITTAQEKKIQSVFVQKQFSTDEALALAREIEAEIIEIDPLQYNWSESMIAIGELISGSLN